MSGKKADSIKDLSKTANKSVTLKRSVTVKAVVTDKFREYMRFEIQSNIQAASQRLGQLDEQLKQASIAPVVREKLTLEREQIQETISELNQRQLGINDWEDGSHFMQGSIDGFVSIALGDNLYEKLGGMEIIVEDGLVKEINPLGAASMSMSQTPSA